MGSVGAAVWAEAVAEGGVPVAVGMRSVLRALVGVKWTEASSVAGSVMRNVRSLVVRTKGVGFNRSARTVRHVGRSALDGEFEREKCSSESSAVEAWGEDCGGRVGVMTGMWGRS